MVSRYFLRHKPEDSDSFAEYEDSLPAAVAALDRSKNDPVFICFLGRHSRTPQVAVVTQDRTASEIVAEIQLRENMVVKWPDR